MARIERPADDRTSNDLMCWELPGTPADEPASCPLLEFVNLLPLRYGRVETPPQGTDSGFPYTLTSRPLGYRLPRNGYIYVLDADAGALHEFHHENGNLTGDNGGKLEYPKSHTLYVGFSEVPWTGRKKAQVMEDPRERDDLLQKIDLASASPLSGGKHLLTPDQARAWVAEFTEEGIVDAPEGGHPQESEPYHWENQPYYHQSRFGKLIKQQGIDDPSNCLCLVLQDDVGVMLDLAQHQDDVVGWIEDWAETGDNERDYVLGALIESMIQLSDEVLGQTAEATGDDALRALVTETDETQRQAIYDYLAVRQDYQGPEPMGTEAYLRENHADNPLVRAQLNMIGTLGQSRFEQHRDAINRLNLRNFQLLNGAGLGQRGMNDLIDRPAMDRFMAQQRARLARWQALLTDITEDRVTLLCDARFHRAAWYFDPEDETQLEAALDLEYACRKDICRSDEAAESVLAWITQNPQYTRVLFQTLPVADRSPEGELAKSYAAVAAAGYSVVTRAADWIQRIKGAEAGKLPAIDSLSREIQQKAQGVGDTIAPAVSRGMAKSLSSLYEAIDGQTLPELDDLFRDLPFFFKRQILEAIDRGEAEFRVASATELDRFRDNLRQMLGLNERLEQLQKQHTVAKATHGHRSPKARNLVAEFKATREEHRTIGKRVAAAISPVEEPDVGLKLDPATTGRAGLTLLLPALDQQEMGRLVGHFRQGLASAPRVNLMGDGLGFVVFTAQAWNFGKAVSELYSSNSKQNLQKDLLKRVGESFLATAAAGFLAGQSLTDTVYGARANALAQGWQRSSLKSVHIRMGRLHVGLGILAYGAGMLSAGLSANKHGNNFLEALRAGNAEAQVGSVLGLAGSGGLTAINAYGLVRTGGSLIQVLTTSGAQNRAVAWAAAGRTLSSLFARLNIAGLIFTVFELGGTWLYNRYNLSERDRWLQTTPWAMQPRREHDGSLKAYQRDFVGLGSSVMLSEAAPSESEEQRLVLNCAAFPPDALTERLLSEPPFRMSFTAWRIQPARRGMFSASPETWVPCVGAILPGLEIIRDAEHLKLAFTLPEPVQTEHGLPTRDLALMVRLDTRQPDGEYTGSVYMLKWTPDSDCPITPVQEPPPSDVKTSFWPIVDPPIALDTLP